ncbi:hypothetical protein PCASD_23119, partial [Puccinia coronata f. sp. avenae]
MKKSLASCNNLLQVYAHKEDTSNDQIVPTLIYSCTRNHTLEVLKVVHEARGIHKGKDNHASTFAHHYHSNTGNPKKAETTSKSHLAQSPQRLTLESFLVGLLKEFYAFYHKEEKKGLANYKPELYFTIEHARGIAQNLNQVDFDKINKIIGGEFIVGQMKMIIDYVQAYCSGDAYGKFLQERQDQHNHV